MTKTDLILPFEGAWLVSNGGLSSETNNHIRAPEQGPQNQLYGYDFRHQTTGEERELSDFVSFGKPVISPGAGRVIQVIDGAIDVAYGERDRNVGVGNTVIIDHENGEYSLLCHLKYDSIQVTVGDGISQGEVVGLCGNTGNTSQPHIHYSLQDGPHMHTAGPLPAQFARIVVNGEVKTRYIPIRDETVRNVED